MWYNCSFFNKQGWALMDTSYREDVKDFLDELLLPIPGVKGGKAFGFPAYKVNGKIFLFVGGDGVSIKIPKAHVADVMASDEAISQFSPGGGSVWKEWVSILRENADDYAQDLGLFEESIQYVAG